MSLAMRLIRGGYVFTGERVIKDGALAITDQGIIHAVGTYEEIRKEYSPNSVAVADDEEEDDVDVLGSSQHWIIPGLINAHHHSNGVSTLLQGVDDDFLEPWLWRIIHTMRTQDPYNRTLYSIAKLLQTGVTSVVDVASTGGTKQDCKEDFMACLTAYDDAGMRVGFAAGVTFDSHLAHYQDEEFLNTLPDELRESVRTKLLPSAADNIITPAEYLDTIKDLHKMYKNHDRIDVWFGPPGPQWVGDKLMVEIVEVAQQLQTQVQTHALESYSEKLIGPKFHGQSMIKHLHSLGILSPQFSIAHGTWLTESDISILCETGAAISHNPSSNLRLRSGIAPLNAMLSSSSQAEEEKEGGVSSATLGLGMDGTTIGDDDDMFAEMRLAARLHRTPQFGSRAPTYDQIFAMATSGGAKLMGKSQEIGKLEPGYQADMVLIKATDRITKPWMAPEVNPLHLLLLRAKCTDVDMVLVGGKVVLRDGMPTFFDLNKVEQELANQLQAQITNKEQIDLVTAVRPYLIQWYANWEQPKLEPYGAFNSKV